MSGTVNLNNEWLSGLSAKNKGELGEAIVETHLRSTLDTAPERFFPSLNLASNDTVSVSRSSVTSYNITSEDNSDVNIWTPDVSLVFKSYGSSSQTKRLLTEVKTGKYAELKDNQKQVMGVLNSRENKLVLRANVKLESEEFVDIQYSTVEPHPDTKIGYRLSPFTLSD